MAIDPQPEVPVVDEIPVPPLRTEAPADFTPKADTFLASWPKMVKQFNASIGKLNALAVWVKAVATGAMDAALASAKAADTSAKASDASAKAAATSADGAASSLASSKVVQTAVEQSAGLPGTNLPGGFLRQKLDGSGQKEWATVIINRVGDAVISPVQPDASFAIDGSLYLQSQWPELFSKIGATSYDVINDQNKVNALPVVSMSNVGMITAAAMGKDEVVFGVDNGGRVIDLTNATATSTVSLSVGQSLNDIATDGKGVFVACGASGIFVRSSDNGKTWVQLGTSSFSAGANSFVWQSIATDGNGKWFAFTNQGSNYYLRSTDNGLTWSNFSFQNTGLAPNYAYRLTHDGVSTWYATAPAGQYDVFKSTNGGLSWAPITRPPMPVNIYQPGSFSPNNYYMSSVAVKGNLLAVATSCDWSAYGTTYTGALFCYSYDNGQTWSWLLYGASAQQGQSFVPGKMVMGGDGTLVVIETQIGSRYVVIKNFYASKKTPILTHVFHSGFSDTFIRAMVTNGLGTWYMTNNNAYRKVPPSYDPKVSFYIPKFPEQPYPFQTYIKARTLV